MCKQLSQGGAENLAAATSESAAHFHWQTESRAAETCGTKGTEERGIQSSVNEILVQRVNQSSSCLKGARCRDSADTVFRLQSSLWSLSGATAIMKETAEPTEPCVGSASHLGRPCCAGAGAGAFRKEARAADMGNDRVPIPGIDDTIELASSDSEENGIALGNAPGARGEQFAGRWAAPKTALT